MVCIFFRGLCNVPSPLPPTPRTIALCLIYFSAGLPHPKLAKIAACELNKTFHRRLIHKRIPCSSAVGVRPSNRPALAQFGI